MNDKKNLIIALLVIALAVLAYILWADTSDPQSGTSNGDQSNIVAEPPPPAPAPTPSPEPSSSSNLADASENVITADAWLVDKITVNGAVVNMDVKVPAALTLSFDKAKKSYMGFAGCNSFSGTYTAPSSGSFKFGVATSTKKYCVDSSQLEADLFQAMGKIEKASVDANGALILSSSDGKTKIYYTIAI